MQPPPSRQVNLADAEQRQALDLLSRMRARPAIGPPPRAGTVAGQLTMLAQSSRGGSLFAIRTHWTEIVGDALARLSQPTRIARDKAGATLVLQVEGAAAPMIQHKAAQILERVRLVAGAGAPARLRIVQGAVRRNSARTPAAPPAPEELRALDQSLDAILDPELRAELAKLGRGVLARTRRTKPPQP
jgi:hypothetical protein